MRVIAPLTGTSPTITDAMLTSTTVAESEPQWLVGTIYALAAIVRGTGDYAHRLFESLQPNNQGHAVTDTAWWVDIGPSNRWAMFDVLRNTQTEGASPMIVNITPGQRVDSIGLAGLQADSVLIEVIVDGITEYSRAVNLGRRDVSNWYEYFFTPFEFAEELALFDLPPYTTAVIRITATKASGTVKIGAVFMNRNVYLGDVEPSAEDDALNFSKINRDDFGNVELIPRRTLPRTKQTTWADRSRVRSIRAVREKLNAVPAMWVGLDDAEHAYFPSLLIVGIYRQFSINLDHETLARVALELEET